MSATTVVGFYDHFEDAQAALRALVDAGIPRADISLLAHRESTGLTGTETFHEGTDYTETKDAAGRDATKGSLLGGLTGFLIGMGFLAIPGVGPLLAAGPLLATLTGAGLGAAAGGLIGALTHAGIPREQADLYAEGIRRGGTLVTVHTDESQAADVTAILDRFHPVDVEERGSQYRTGGYTGYQESAPSYTAEQIAAERARYASQSTMPTTTIPSGEQAAIPVVEESLVVGKRAVQGGGARVHTRVIETPVEETVTLREEHVTVERHPVNRAATSADLADALQDGVIEVTATSEEAVVAKQARVVEEVVVGKEATQHTETISDTVRRTNVEVEEVSGEATTATTATPL